MKFWVIVLLVLNGFMGFGQSVEKSNPNSNEVEQNPLMGLEEYLVIDTVNSGLCFQTSSLYNFQKKNLQKQKKWFQIQYQSAPDSTFKAKVIDSASTFFKHALLCEIFPYWYGTTWEFNGYTSKPNEGNIACGYFVSTTLRDVGVHINRYKLAQQGPLNEAKSLSISPKEIQEIRDTSIFNELEKLTEGLYFIGLDYHVGFIAKIHGHCYFIHSNYIKGKVMVEIATQSEAFNTSELYYLVDLSNNLEFIKSWMLNHEISVVRE